MNEYSCNTNRPIAFRAETCEGCDQIYNGYDHAASLEHVSCHVFLLQAKMLNWRLDNPFEWARLKEKFIIRPN